MEWNNPGCGLTIVMIIIIAVNLRRMHIEAGSSSNKEPVKSHSPAYPPPHTEARGCRIPKWESPPVISLETLSQPGGTPQERKIAMEMRRFLKDMTYK